MTARSPVRNNLLSVALMVLGVALLVGCSDDPEVAVRTGEGTADEILDLHTDGSTTTSTIGGVGATDATVGDTPSVSSVDDDALTGPARPGLVISPVTPVDPGAPLGSVLLSSGPVGWTRASDDAPDLGPLTVVEVASALGDPEAELALLTTRRLRTAHARRWTSADGAVATVVAYQFADAEGALAYEIDSMLSLVAAGATESTGAASSRAFSWEQGTQRVDGRSLRRGERLYLVIVRQGTPAIADALVDAQARQLAG